MHDEVSHGAGTRERIAENLYRRRTKAGRQFEVVFRDVDGRSTASARGSLRPRCRPRGARDPRRARRRDRIVGAELTIDELAERDYFPMLDALAAAGRRSERNVDDDRDRYRLHVQAAARRRCAWATSSPRHVSELVAAMRARRPKPYAEATIENVLGVVRGIYRLARSRGYVSRSPVDGLDPAERRSRAPSAGPAARRARARRARPPRARGAPRRRDAARLLRAAYREALGLRWRHVDLVDGELDVRGQLQTGRRDRATRIVGRLKSEAERPHGADLPRRRARARRGSSSSGSPSSGSSAATTSIRVSSTTSSSSAAAPDSRSRPATSRSAASRRRRRGRARPRHTEAPARLVLLDRRSPWRRPGRGAADDRALARGLGAALRALVRQGRSATRRASACSSTDSGGRGRARRRRDA